MKIVLTGSLGNISKPLAEELIGKGHAVTVISSNLEKSAAIQALGATPAIGSIADARFLTETFSGADAVYCMIPFSFKEQDQEAYFKRVAGNYVEAIRQNGAGRVVFLSGWAAGITKSFNVGSLLDGIPGLTEMRPASFYSNFYDYIGMIKGKGTMGSLMALRFYGLGALLKGQRGLIAANVGGEDKMVFVAPKDIATAVAEELEKPATGKKVRYVGSEEMTCNEAARILGNAIGKPYLKWATLSTKQMQKGLEMAGMPSQLAAGILEMQEAMHNGSIQARYYENRPVLGKTKLAEFAKEFAVVYHKK